MTEALPILAGSTDPNVIKSVVLAIVAAFAAAFLAAKLKLPSVLLMLVAGVLIGPAVFNLITDKDSIDLMADIGIVFLLFAIGLKFSLKELVKLRRIVLGLGGLQVGITACISAGIAYWFGLGPEASALFGMLFALSSTAVVLKVLEERGGYGSPAGKLAFGTLLFQDVAAILLIVLVPLLKPTDAEAVNAATQATQSVVDAGSVATNSTSATSGMLGVALQVGQALLVIALLYIVSRLLLPWIFSKVVATRSREVFSLATIVIVIGTAWAAGAAGVSLVMGAFVAGMVLSETDFSRQVLADIVAIRDTLTGLFFVSIGLLIDPGIWATDGGLIIGLSLGAIVVKALIVGVVGSLLGFSPKISLTAGIFLAQVGEFSFVAARKAEKLEIISHKELSIIIAVAVVTMALTPALMSIAPRFVSWISGKPVFKSLLHDRREAALMRKMNEGETARGIENHVVIVGFGVSGHNVARMLRQAEIPYVIIEMNRDTVRRERENGEKAFFGDATRPEILHAANIEKARAVVVTVPSAPEVEGVVASAYALNPHAMIVARTRYLREMDVLERLGATVVVPEEFETSLELAAQALLALGGSDWGIALIKRQIREEHYKSLSDDDDPLAEVRNHLDVGLIFGAGLEAAQITEGSDAIGQTLINLDLRRKTGASVIAVSRGGQLIRNPGGDFELCDGDALYLFGSQEEIDAAAEMLGRRRRMHTIVLDKTPPRPSQFFQGS